MTVRRIFKWAFIALVIDAAAGVVLVLLGVNQLT